eukprot:TRINITY_DN1911_c0_g1_i1.p1 TRINITY_DN1911_c0_g1~~TRINITY_DN1911_c0_g1_i1.p1  ORF type:complete len:769 (+),score=200.66 TRINITY_DN1911_c0_g1_i1:123-2429(+)
MNFDEAEEQDGIRFAWNVWPSSRLEATRSLVVPLGCMYTPLRKNPNTPLVYYEPVFCKGPCRSVLNPFCNADIRGRLWVCPFCFQRNQFPPNYADISEQNLPAELLRPYTTIEYALAARAPVVPPVYLYVIDTCMSDEDLQALKDSLIMSLSLLPENAFVGLITFGSTIQVYELSFVDCPKSFVFRGNKDVTTKQISELLGFAASNKGQQAPQAPQMGMNSGVPTPVQSSGFLMPLSECEFTLTSILEELQRDPRPVPNDKRPLRGTGVAISVAIGLLEATFANNAGRIMVFTGGPCTEGPGMVVAEELKEPIRSHSDIVKDKAKYVTKAAKHYEALAKRSVGSGHVIDMYACSLDQVGMLEMRDLVKKTGGYSVLADGFDQPMFKSSFQRLFTRDQKGVLNQGFNATLDVVTSRELKVCGGIGHMASLNKAGPSVADTEIGMGGTSAWKICGVDPGSTYALYFEVVNQHTNPIPPEQTGLIQFLTHYQNSSGQRILRVTTVSRQWAQGSSETGPGPIPALASGFDQETAAVLMARIAVYKAENEESPDILRWIDRMLIRLVSKFADYRKDDPNSFRLAPNFSIYPQFMFHLRRSHFLQVFNSSPDETTFYRAIFNRENVTNSLIMIQPTLEAYSFAGPPVPVLLSATSVQPERILLLDTFFHIVVFYGDQIAGWRKAGYQDDPQHANLKQLLVAPKDDASLILKERFPYPRYIECDQHTSQARFLLATIDPNITHNSMGNTPGEVIFTDDVNLKVFMEHLKKLAVQP